MVVPENFQHVHPGMSLLDYFAAQAMVNLMPPLHGWNNAAIAAYNMAEAMMAERKRRSEVEP